MTRPRDEIVKQAQGLSPRDLIFLEVLLDIRGQLGALIKLERERGEFVTSLVKDLK